MIVKKQDLLRHLRRLGLPGEGIAYVMRCYSAMAPARRGKGNYGCVHDTIASRKNGFTTNSESRHAEGPFLFWCEFNPAVVLYLDQPEAIKITYFINGKKVGYQAIFDFLVIENQCVYVVECKRFKDLVSLAASNDTMYVKQNENFISPPAQEACSKYGFGHRVVKDTDFSVNFTRNCFFLLGFVDDRDALDEQTYAEIKDSLRRLGSRLRLSSLYDLFPQKKLISGVLQSKLFFDIDAELLVEPDNVWIYDCDITLRALKKLKKQHELIPVTEVMQLERESKLWWNNKEWNVLRFSADPEMSIELLNGAARICLKRDDLYRLINDKEIYCSLLSSYETEAQKLIVSTSNRRLEEAEKRQAILNGDPRTQTVSKRTISRLKARFEQAIRQHGDGFIGLIDQTHKRGNREARLSKPVIKLMESYFEKALTKSPPKLKRYFDDFVREAETRYLQVPSSKTFYKRFAQYSDFVERVRIQQGQRAAYALGPEPRDIDLSQSLPYHGDHAFQIAHIDHSPIEMCFISKLNGSVLPGTLHLSVMYDGYSRVILAIYVSFEKPSYRATMMLLRECFKRHGVLPIWIALDRGPDFESTYMDKTLATLGMHKRRRPVGYSRHGSNIERIFGIAETEFVHCLLGNKQLQKLGRSLSSTHNPKKLAVWQPDDFFIALKEYAYFAYPNVHRSGICDTPENRFKQSIAQFDEKPGTKVKSEKHFYFATLPDIKGGKDGKIVILKNQVKYKNINYLLSKSIPGYHGEKRRVRAKYDPYDIRFIWALIDKIWVQLNTTDLLLRECFDKGVRYPHLEVYARNLKQKRLYLKGKSSPGISMASLEQKEMLLFSQNNAEQLDAKGIKDGDQLADNFDIGCIQAADVEIHEVDK
ncbi:Integrase core domain protein [Teredinibacter turnerae T7901]|uniref:Integrase core domain protein n=1 Tax=Teredinibacter turnerae (strain ATCC 39867 / T7901) TaxID=377629 RepID=C5BUJ7_TERTT|nr:DDE-type integrase/transposase/recombinase [Teredinibacter turnerae]ACR13076.1 Integrase core domain protein [Teredinibacter turnerae T7901]